MRDCKQYRSRECICFSRTVEDVGPYGKVCANKIKSDFEGEVIIALS